MYSNDDIEKYGPMIVFGCRVRLPYILVSLYINDDVHLPSAICQMYGEERPTAVNPLILGGAYKPMKVGGLCYDYNGRFSRPTIIEFGSMHHEGVMYKHLTLHVHRELGTPADHCRYAQHDSILLNSSQHIKEYLSAPYRFNPRAYNSIFDLFVYPPHLLDKRTATLIYLWMYIPSTVYNLTSGERFKYADTYGVCNIVSDGKYILSPDILARVGQMANEDVATLSHYFHL